jgi:mannan endo-1,4-beta-mannosidase
MIGKGADYIAAHQYWQCDRAQTIKSVIGTSPLLFPLCFGVDFFHFFPTTGNNSGILVTTGGESWLDESIQPDWFTCPYLDVLAIHAYGDGDFDQSNSPLPPSTFSSLSNSNR